MSDEKQKRKILFIQKEFQSKSIATIVFIIAASGLISGAILYFLLSSELSSQLQVAHNQIQNTWDKLAPAVIFGNLLTVIITGIVAAIVILYQSHKIAGPMYRIQTICEDIAEGNYKTMTSLRKNDQLSNLAKSFEKMLDSLSSRKLKREQELKLIIEKIQVLEVNTDNQIKQEALLEIKSIIEAMELS